MPAYLLLERLRRQLGSIPQRLEAKESPRFARPAPQARPPAGAPARVPECDVDAPGAALLPMSEEEYDEKLGLVSLYLK